MMISSTQGLFKSTGRILFLHPVFAKCKRVLFGFFFILVFKTNLYCQSQFLDLTGILKFSGNDNALIATENATILNRILQRAKNSGSVIRLPKGIIWIASPIIVPSGITITGHPEGSTIAVSASIRQITEGFIVNENYLLYTAEKDENITLLNFTLIANKVIPEKGQPRGIYLNKVQNVLIKNVQVYGTVAEGIRVDASNLDQTTANVTVTNCLINKRGSDNPCIMIRSFTEDGTNSSNTPTRISAITLQGNTCIGGGHGILLFNTGKVLVLENKCTANLYRGIIAGPTCKDVIIRKNRIDSAGSTGIHLAYFAENITIDSNYVTNSIADMSGKGGEGQGIKAYVGFRHLTITNNTCINNATDGIALEGGGYGSDFVIKKNRCEKNKRNGIRVWAGKLYGTNKGDIEGGIIEKNTLRNNGQEGLFISSDDGGKSRVKNLRASKNIIKALPGKKKMKVDHTTSDVIISQ